MPRIPDTTDDGFDRASLGRSLIQPFAAVGHDRPGAATAAVRG